MFFEGSAKIRPFAPDAARGARAGQIPARIHVFDCADVPALFERMFALRKELTGPTALVHELPFSALFAAHEARVNGRWVDKPGYLAAGDRRRRTRPGRPDGAAAWRRRCR